MRIAIDSTLHHYRDVLSDAAKRRFGVDAGIVAATLTHPWNREVRETEDVIAADWS